MRHTRPHETAALWLLAYAALGGALCASTDAQTRNEVKPKGAPVSSDPDLKPAPAPRPMKEGSRPRGNEALSLEARRALDLAVTSPAPGGEAEGAASSTREGKSPLVGGEHVFPSIAGPGSSFVQLDTAPDGALWAIGGNYKASFDRSGATFIPFLGSDAPQNYPFTLGDPTLSIDGRTIETAGTPLPHWEGSKAVFERGPFREVYEVRTGELEQLFVFNELPERGSLVLRTGVESTLSHVSSRDQLSFRGERGGVNYSHAVAIDAAGRTIDIPTTYEEGDIVLRVPAEFVAGAALPLTIDPIIATFSPSSSAAFNDTNADLSWDDATSRWLVVWQRNFSSTDADVWVEAFDQGGNSIAGTGGYLNFSSAAWRAPRVANNRAEHQFLVVAEVENANFEIWGRTVEAGSGNYGPQIKISPSANDCRAPDIGGDPAAFGNSYYMVVWERVTFLGIDHDILGQRVDPDSTLVGSTTVIDNTTGTYDKVPSISKSSGIPPFTTQRWNVVWQRQFAPTDWDIIGAQLRADGTLVAPAFVVTTSTKDDRWPQAASPLEHVADDVERHWMAAFERRDSDGISDIHVAPMKGQTVGRIKNLSELLGASAVNDQVQPALDSNRDHFAVYWSQRFNGSSTDFDTYVASVYVAGTIPHVAEGPLRLAGSALFEGKVQAASQYSGGTPSDWVGVIWRRSTASDSDVGAAIYECLDHYGPFIGTPYCGPIIPNSSGQSAVIEASGSGYAGGNPLTLTAYHLPSNTYGYFIGSTQTQSAMAPGTNGRVCVGNPLSRFNQPQDIKYSGPERRFDIPVDSSAIPLPAGGTMSMSVGQTFYFQCWFRDGTSSNFTNGTAVTFH